MLAERSLTMQMRSPVARLERKRTRIPTVAVTNRIYKEDLDVAFLV